ncbi:MAG: hypothetical protein M3Q56_09020 [Bacteroidota bacterium]|nr:hypothetical protein [Bacteroidota bacterium]
MMQNESLHRLQYTIWFISLILAPLLLTVSQFFWHNGLLSNTAGWLQVLAFTFWIPAFQAMFHLIKEKMPVYAILGFLVAIYACIGGNNFGVDGIYGEALQINLVDAKNELHQKFGIGGVIALYIPGVLFPLSLLILGVNFLRTKSMNVWVATILIIGAIGFPLSRIPREPIVAHLDNVLLLIAQGFIAFKYFKK